MEYNLLQTFYDLQCRLFEEGLISLDLFMKLEDEYAKLYKLFIINLN